MRLRRVKNAMEMVTNSPYVIDNVREHKEEINKLFLNDNKSLRIEIGMGKGDFIIGMALKYPDINFIGIERYESVMIRAIEKLKDMEIPNLRLIHMDALDIDQVFFKEVDMIYLNFSDPWPKNKHEKRRLTSDIFLAKYDKIFKDKAHIIQKTDNIKLFAYSISNLSKNGYILENVSLDLEHEDIDNVLTEYEKKFMSKGVKINYLEAVKHLKN